MANNRDSYEKWADKYDQESEKIQWHGPAILFGLMYLHVNPGESLLDLGIGTGLGSLPFLKAGLGIHGLDRSQSMLEQCRNRQLPITLVQHDLQETPWPLADSTFDHVIATGITHFIPDLQAFVSEISRVTKPGGLFGFDYYPYDPADPNDCLEIRNGVYEFYDAEYDHRYYRHSGEYITSLLSDAGFAVLSETEFLASKGGNKYFRALVSRH